MAFTASYNATINTALAYIYRATSGGTVFSSNLASSAAFDYFDDTAVANDAIYFAASNRYANMSDFKFNIGTAMAGTDIVLIWEYTRWKTGNTYEWIEIPNTIDGTGQFTNTGEQIFQFPYPPYLGDATINGISSTGWIRCRIVSLTAITEGGANQTATVKTGNGILYISGTDDATPATWTNVYDWVVANKPHLSPTKLGNVFLFPHCSIIINSPLKTENETILQGNGNGACNVYFEYITSGRKYGDYNAYNFSNFYNCATLGTSRIRFSETTGRCKVYGGCMGSFYYDDGYIATLGQYYSYGGVDWGGGEYIQVQSTGGFSGYLSVGAVMKNCSLNGEFTTTGFPTSVTALDRVTVFNGAMSDFTNNNGTLVNLDIIRPNSYKISHNTNVGNQKIYFINPITQFPTQTTVVATSMVAINTVSPTTAISKVFFYDDSTGTYTDYTAEAQSVAANDVPINGDVNDIIYFLATGVDANYAPVLNFDLTNVSNDYVYQWQVYTSSGWENVDKIWDQTNNFIVNSKYIYIKNSISTGSDGSQKRNAASVTINGVAGYWVRLKIITKGTGTPTFSRVRSGYQMGISEWKYYQQYTVDLKILDEANATIENATVVFKDKNGNTLFTAITGVDGKITQQTVTQREWFFDPINFPLNYSLVGSTDYDPFQIYVSKVGYETYYIKKDITAKIDETIALKKAVPVLVGINTGKDYLKLNPDNLNSREIIID